MCIRDSSGSGFQKMVGPKGSQISGGQKQRIAIARCLLKDPPLFLFDEATSALDNQNEKMVQDCLNSVMVGRTSITVAHRITTIKDADQILVMQDGKIVERGTYDTLTNDSQGVFYKLERGILLETDDRNVH
eukprot:TRINITY_DN10930_c0_g1_i1.p2 TRINITY_DN10930_c0_g1~~TRINITY_DN10930_c0_g1_i1.p2  ORF type:complete len:132 (+),score=21.85 TRINITY_DN10930_c0_g1_i1:64-459(+)